MNMIKFTDLLTDVKATTHKDGYKIVRAKVARSGIQEYYRFELGDAAPIGNPMDTIKVYRAPDQVFSDKSLNGWSHVPITLDHPPELVTPDNYRDYAVGEVTSKAKIEDDWLWLEFLVKDGKSITASDTTHKQYSGGYTAVIDFSPGVTPSGDEYDAAQIDINPNHLALVPAGRAFADALREGANPWGAAPLTKPKEETLVDMIKVMVGDSSVNVAAADADKVMKLIADHKAAIDTVKAELAAVKIECADATKKIKTDAEIAAMVADGVKELGEVVEKAKLLVADYDATGKDAMTIRGEVIAKVYGDEAKADLVTDAEIKAAFKVAQSRATPDPVRDAIKDSKPKSDDPWAKHIKMKGNK